MKSRIDLQEQVRGCRLINLCEESISSSCVNNLPFNIIVVIHNGSHFRLLEIVDRCHARLHIRASSIHKLARHGLVIPQKSTLIIVSLVHKTIFIPPDLLQSIAENERRRTTKLMAFLHIGRG